MAKSPRFSSAGYAVGVFALFCCIAVIHSCLFYLDLDTPADPRGSSVPTCISWEKHHTLRTSDLKPNGTYSITCKEYRYAQSNH